MSYIGRSPQIGGYHKLDSITCDGSTAYTMQLDSANFSPESVNHLIVSVNGVIQAPTTSYTISGSTITFASALSSSDTIDFIMALGNVLDIGTPSDSTVSLSKLTATGTPSASTFLRGDNSWASAGGDNTPAFSAVLTSNQTLTSGTTTLVAFDTKEFDTDSAFDNTSGNYKFTVPSGKAGKYQFNTILDMRGSGASSLTIATVRIYKNGSVYHFTQFHFQSNNPNEASPQVSILMDLAVSDYIQIYGHVSTTSGGDIRASDGGAYTSRFSGFRLVE